MPDASWDESAPAGAGFGQDAPAAPPTDDWGAAPGAGAAGKLFTAVLAACFHGIRLHHGALL